MKRLALLTLLFGILAPTTALADSSTPNWCGGVTHGECLSARADLMWALQARYGDGVAHANPLLENCPVGGSYNGVANCMTYFKYHGTYRFLDASITAAQDSRGTAKLSYISAWRRQWRECSLHERGIPQQPPGSLETNEPCGALPMEAVYTVMIEMNGAEGSVGFVHHPGWQFTESAYFGAGEMAKVSSDTCAYKNHAITCSDREGDSFRYIY